MFCCIRGEAQRLGFVRVKTQDVIESCRSTIRSINRSRSKIRRNYVAKHLEGAEKWWRRFWWLGFSKPTRRNALRDFYHESMLPPALEMQLYCCEQESNCKKLLNAALASERPTMWVSPEGIRACNL